MTFFVVVVLGFVLGFILRLSLIKVNENKYGFKLNGTHQFWFPLMISG
jgi:hypothetical protein